MPYTDKAKQKAYAHAWYKAYYKKNRKEEYRRVKERRDRLRGWLDEYKLTLACAMCGEKHPACLDFHHSDSKTKDFSVGNVRAWGWGKERILREIEKCVVLCANCHRKTHFQKRKGR